MTKKMILAALFAVALAKPAAAQTQTATWQQPNVNTAAQATAFTYRLYTTPVGASQANPPVTITAVTCTGTGTAPITVSCTGTATDPAAIVTGNKTTITSQDAVNGTLESAQSVPFMAGSAVPTTLIVK